MSEFLIILIILQMVMPNLCVMLYVITVVFMNVEKVFFGGSVRMHYSNRMKQIEAYKNTCKSCFSMVWNNWAKCECALELLSVLAARAEKLLKSMLLKEIEEEIPMVEREASVLM